MTRVDEPNAPGQLGEIAAPNQPTYYLYDPGDNLTEVSQTGTNAEQCGATAVPCSQTRSFAYNSLSRLVSATNPESGTIVYAYDPNGNLTSKTDARNITNAYSYDPINRVTLRNYSDSTYDVSFTYDDPAVAYSKGMLTKTDNGFSKTEMTEFDRLGRVKKSRQTTDGTAYNEMEYTCNLSGAMVEEKYPSGRVVRNVLDAEGDLSMVQSKRNANYGYWNYAHHFTYTAAGAVASMQLGNGTWEKTAFNSRLQPTQIALGRVPNATDLLKLDYTYGTVVNGQLDTTKNNGNIQSQTITVPTVGSSNGFTAVQTYHYDSLNRIDEATETVTLAGSSTATQSWKQNYTFNRYGNRNFIEANTTTIPKNCGTPPNLTVCEADRKVFNPNVNASNNRLSSSDGYQFDDAGNTTRDAQFRKFTYDAENKQTKVESVNASGTVTGTIGEYFYDGDGRRVKKIAYANNQQIETTVFVYDASSRLVAEYSTNLNPTPQVAYLTADYLGSPRINTNENGEVISRHDYRPYGEEVTERTHSQYAADTIRKQFTGYERDGETDLDFAQARVYNAWLGRFTAADGVSNDTQIGDPSSWNLYAYVRNSPLTKIDPSGEEFNIAVNGIKYSVVLHDAKFTLCGPDKVLYDGDGKSELAVIGYLNRMSTDFKAQIDDLITADGVHDLDVTFGDNADDSDYPGNIIPGFAANKEGVDVVQNTTAAAVVSLAEGQEDASYRAFGVQVLGAAWLIGKTQGDIGTHREIVEMHGKDRESKGWELTADEKVKPGSQVFPLQAAMMKARKALDHPGAAGNGGRGIGPGLPSPSNCMTREDAELLKMKVVQKKP